jgi:hypothetical protein
VRLTPRELARLHHAATAVIALLEADALVIELSVHAHMLLLSLVEALERGNGLVVREVADCLPAAWRARLPEMASAIAVTLRRAGAGVGHAGAIGGAS